MITQDDIEKNRLWLSKTRKHGGCIYNYIKNPRERAKKCKNIFPNLQKDKHKKCNLVCPCDQYGTRYVINIIKKLVDAGQATNK